MKYLRVALVCLMFSATAAMAQDSFKVVTYNIGSGASGIWKDRLINFEGLASHILLQNPDVVVLQEVHDNFATGRKPVTSQPDYWKTRLGMKGHYVADYKAWSFWGYSLGTSGNMILSKWPIVQVDDDLRPRTDSGAIGLGIGVEKFEDNKMSVVLDIRGKRVRVGAMHLGGSQRILRYLQWLESYSEPAILAGDANTDWHELNGSDSNLRTAGARFVSIPNSAVADQCGAIDWIMVQRGILKVNAWDYGRVNRRCSSDADNLTDHPLVQADVGFEPVPVRNPGFESYFENWSNWSPHSNYSANAFPNCGHSGIYCAAQFGDGGIIFRDLTGLIPGVSYEICAWVFNGSRSAGKLSVHNTKEGNYMETPFNSSQGTWVKMTVIYTADETRRVRIHLVRRDSSAQADFLEPILWDDVTVTPSARH